MKVYGYLWMFLWMFYGCGQASALFSKKKDPPTYDHTGLHNVYSYVHPDKKRLFMTSNEHVDSEYHELNGYFVALPMYAYPKDVTGVIDAKVRFYHYPEYCDYMYTDGMFVRTYCTPKGWDFFVDSCSKLEILGTRNFSITLEIEYVNDRE